MLHIAICDDDPKQIGLIKDAAENYAKGKLGETIQITEFNNPLLFLEEKGTHFDIVLLDICMPGLLGTEVAKELRTRKDNTEIIFLTTSEEFAIEAFSVKAAHYIVKPFTQEQFSQGLDRAIELLSLKGTRPIVLKTSGGVMKKIEADEITFIESAAHTQTIHLKEDESFDTKMSMGEMLTLLEQTAKEQFAVPHKGYIINLKRVRTIEASRILMQDGCLVPLSRNNSKTIREQYFNFQFGGGASK